MRKDLEGSLEAPARTVEMRRRRRPPIVQILGSPAYDLLFSLHVAFSPPRMRAYEVSAEWIEHALAACSPDLRERLAFYFGTEEGQWCAARLCAFLWRSPAPASIAATLDWLQSLPAEEIIVELIEQDGLGDDWRDVATALIRSSLEGRDDQSARIASFARRFPADERDAVVRFVSQPEVVRSEIIGGLRAWHDLVFAAEEPRIAAAVSREAARMERQKSEMPFDQLFASVIHGIEQDLPASVERVVLAPCLMTMPTIFHFTDQDTLTYCYPIPDAARAEDPESAERQEVLRLFETLADDTRLRILRHLAHKQMYLTELADHLRLTKATTRHHMIKLRAAGLVTVHIRDHLTYYSLRHETLNEPTNLLLHYLRMR
jgi:DNA-binding transcriptional ArsR family regulator